jgi:acyl dehydratase
MPRLYFEDFEPGTTDSFGSCLVTREDIIAFARAYDPQPMHLDEAAAAKTILGGLAASGWHICAMLMRMIADGFVNRSAGMGAPGIEEVKWLKPVRPGDTLRVKSAVLDKKASVSKPDRGFVRFRFELLNQNDEVVLEQTNLIMLGRREPGVAA